MWRSVASNALTLFIALFLLAGGLLLWGKRQYEGAGPLADAICLRVESGATMAGLSRQLEGQGAVSNAAIFRLGAKYTDKADLLKAGSFLIPPGSSMKEIVDIVTRGGRSTCGSELNFRIGVVSAQLQLRQVDPGTGRYVEVLAFDPAAGEIPEDYAELRNATDLRFRVTLAEGVTSWQAVEELKLADFLDGEVADLPAEGSLAPDSYEVQPGMARSDLIAEMQRRQVAILDDLWARRADDLPITTPEEALILASIVEKETGVPEERGQVASVFVNRLRQGMRLQTDPTVIYGVTQGREPLGRGIRQSELRRETPWNTYVIDGLPPTPIANPGRASIEAALNPEDTDFLFFVADGTGGHAFARTLAEHNQNVARWRQIEAGRQ
ncbi:endolytic transglycosylase MltG [Rhodovulum sp.]|uniref:endolytic transglycosylase MltG n=1 Tax=Rhodovulum sp. TaxID=34009 RepID=UPI00185CD82F|nr:endolytic transglycosylase MltG [Rhodovulum sp.]HDR27099.1 endolytic transglycosylase MltG [Rhodovulum sp.]